VQHLLDRGAELNYQDPAYLKTSLHQAISRRKLPIAKLLVSAGAKYDIPDNKGVTAVEQVKEIYQHSRELGDTPEIMDLLRLMESDWQATGQMLILACHSKSDPSWVLYLAKRGANVNYQDLEHHNTPLHLAVIRRQYETAKVLIKLGAKSTIANKAGKKPADYIIEIFESPNKDDDLDELNNLFDLLQTHRQATGKMFHLSKDNPLLIQLLMDRRADAEFKNSNGDNALHFAIQMKNYANAKVLVETGADLNSTSGAGLTVVQALTLFIDKNESKSERIKRKELLELVKNKQ